MDWIKNPQDIEQKSFEIIGELLGDRPLDPLQAPIIKRVIHTTADFDYLEQLAFTEEAVPKALAALKQGARIVTDTTMALSGINKRALGQLGGEVRCYIADEEVARRAKETGQTRSFVAVDRALEEADRPLIFVVGNAPTALLRLYERVRAGQAHPAFIVGVPVGFVNVVEAKELIRTLEVPSIVARGRKGGSNVAAAIINALLYQLVERN
ncbi:Cobalt-precorrin-8x methylmutase [Clostridiaceae bacterium JG1575]|nr:Cobalt-precorrin-8x methylmutase [Clostridiaceae bacterium JG1575]